MRCMPLPEGFEFRALDPGVLARCEWREMIEMACGSLDNFVAHGFGICLMRGEEIVAEG